MAAEAVKLFMHSLPIGSKFNIVSYGSEHTKLFETSQPYNDENFEKAIANISTFDADMGGTEIYEPIQDLLKLEAEEGLPRHLYLLTDGAVSDTDKIVQLIKKNRDACKVHTFGIGSGASTELIKKCAQAGHGHYSFIYNLDEIEKKVIEALQKDFLEYLSVKEALILDEDRNVIRKLPEDIDLSHGTKYEYLSLL